MDDLTIILVDDEEAHLTLMKRSILKQLPHSNIHCYRDARSCFEALNESLPDVIVTDYIMPGMNGVAFLESLKQKGLTIPVVIITGHGDEHIAVQAMKLGAGDYLVKSADIFDLLPGIISRVVREQALKVSLEETRKRFQDIAERMFSWIWETDARGIYTYSNPAVETILGYGPEDLMGRSCYDFFHEAEKEDLKHIFLGMKEGRGELSFLEHSLVHRNGHKVPIETNALPVNDKDGNFLGYRGISRDITERIRMEAALRESEAQKRAILDASIDRIRYLDKKMKVIWANKKTTSDLDMSLEEIVGQVCYKLFLGADSPCKDCPYLKARKTGKVERSVIRRHDISDSGRDKYWDVYCVPFKDEAGEISSIVEIARDITDYRLAEEHIHILAQQILNAHESERRMISLELHDKVAQDLLAIKMDLDTMLDNEKDVSQEIRKRIFRLSSILLETIIGVRDLSYDLRPPHLDRLGLAHTLLRYCEEFADRTGLEVDFSSAGMDNLDLDSNIEINLYRLVQEGLNNVRKHAEASHVAVRLVSSFPNIILRIEDDGRGFDVDARLAQAASEKRMGLRSMEERVGLLDGRMDIRSVPGEGTRIFIEVPYHKGEESGA